MSRESRRISCSSSPVYMKTSRGPRVSYEQVEALVDYMEYNQELACGYLNTTAGRYKATQKWHIVANSLNAMGSGAKKNGKGWSAYWSNFKNKLKGRVRKLRSMANGEQIQTTTLSDIDRRALAILGPRYDITQFNIQVEVDPFSEDGTNDDAYIPDSPPSREASPEQAEPACTDATPALAQEPRPDTPKNLTTDHPPRKRPFIPEPSPTPPPPQPAPDPVSRVAAAVEALVAAQAQHAAAMRDTVAALRVATAALESVAAAVLQRSDTKTSCAPNDPALTPPPIKKEKS